MNIDLIKTMQIIHDDSKSSSEVTVSGDDQLFDLKFHTKESILFDPQPLATIFDQCKVGIPAGQADNKEDIADSISALDKLIDLLSSADPVTKSHGFAPGFFTRESDEGWVMKVDKEGRCYFDGQYENMNVPLSGVFNSTIVPMPSCIDALTYFHAIRESWRERERWATTPINEREGLFCSCIATWDHNRTPILMQLATQTLSMLRVSEASERCTRMLKREEWNEMYSPDKCTGVHSLRKEMYIPNTSIKFFDGRHDYVSAYVNAALTAKETIDICLCFIYPNDPVQRYILLDLLPFVARNNGVTVRILMDLMTIESDVIKSAIAVDSKMSAPASNKGKGKSDQEAMKFVDHLPLSCPPFSDIARRTPENMLSLLNDLCRIQSSIPHDCLQIRWWCARDKKEKFRIKSHIKCHIFDGKVKGTVITGGSNLTPILNFKDSDVILRGEISKKYHRMFDDLWVVSAPDTDDPSLIPSGGSSEISELEVPTTKTDFDKQPIITEQTNWTDSACSVAFLNSIPSSMGEDCILRHIIGAINDAKNSVTMCMGHANVPMPVAKALATATSRGVSVRLLFNSLYTCDIRCGQKDLFLSLRDLFDIAPSVQIYVTALSSHRIKGDDKLFEKQVDEEINFLHSKYVVVDSEWSAVGSWNMWIRAAFHELEAELFVFSKSFANALENKFEREKEDSAMQIKSHEDIAFFCPRGCKLCKPFGPFYQDVK